MPLPRRRRRRRPPDKPPLAKSAAPSTALTTTKPIRPIYEIDEEDEDLQPVAEGSVTAILQYSWMVFGTTHKRRRP